MKCDIIIPVWDQPEITRGCIDSIVRHTDCSYRLIIIDNGSGPGTRGYLKSLDGTGALQVILIRNNENVGFVKAVNQGMRISDSPYLCLLNNDTIVTHGWLKNIIDIMETHPEVGMANPSSNTSGQFPDKGKSIDEYALSLKQFKGKIQELYTCRGFCMVIKRDVIGRLGLFDEIYNLGYFEETDYSIRAQAAGFKIARVKSSYVYHKENTTFKSLRDHNAFFKANEKIFFARWGRTLRIAYLVDDEGFGDKVDNIASNAARSGHQMIIFLKDGLSWPVSIDHFGIRRVDINRFLFGLISIYKIIKYKRKKKIDILLTDSEPVYRLLRSVRGLLGVKIIYGPKEDNILSLLRSATA